VGAVAALAGAVFAAWPIAGATGIAPGEAAGGNAVEAGRWQSYTPDRVAQLTGDGRAVFVDFTAAWCVTCQVNKQLVLNTDAVQDAFARSKVTLVRADWTRRDPAIGKALAALGRNGVPVYVLYRPGQGPLLLPEVLQQRNILEALATL
jgi:thiol:disulfide interchange protein DsbD